MNNLIWKKKTLFMFIFNLFCMYSKKEKRKRKKPISMFIFVLNLPSDKTLQCSSDDKFFKTLSSLMQLRETFQKRKVGTPEGHLHLMFEPHIAQLSRLLEVL